MLKNETMKLRNEYVISPSSKDPLPPTPILQQMQICTPLRLLNYRPSTEYLEYFYIAPLFRGVGAVL